MNPEWEARVADKHRFIAQETQTGRQVGDKCKLMGPKAPRVAYKCGKQV